MERTKPTNLEILLCSSEDYEKITLIYNEYICMGTATMAETPHSAEDIQGWVDKFNDREKLFVLKDAQDVIGWGIIKRYSDREGYRLACETAVYIASSELRKGHGSRMKKFLIEQCKLLGYHHLIAKVFATNIASIQYNLSLGYSTVGTQKEIGFKNNKWVDIVIMQYIIDNK